MATWGKCARTGRAILLLLAGLVAVVVVTQVARMPTARAAAGYPNIECSKDVKNPLFLLGVSDLHDVSRASACAVWAGTLKLGSPTKCIGKPFTRGAYAVVVRHRFHGWRISLVDLRSEDWSVIRFSRDAASFEAGGQDAPPYPCGAPRP
ncbi:MAG: hypothetical protein ABSH51_26820 [Solirubrobacteraceae bacterium]